MQAVIMAAGEGSRMHPLTTNRPKPMLPIAAKPILEHVIMQASLAGVKDFIIITGYRADVIQRYFADGSKWGLGIRYCLQNEALGTADALRMVRDMVDDRFLVMSGDNIVGKDDIEKLAQSQQITMTVKELDDVSGLGVVNTSGGLVQSIVEKPEPPVSGLANAGTYLMTCRIFGVIEQTPRSPRGEYELTRSLGILLEQGVKVACQPIDFWLNLSYPWDLLDASARLLADMEAHSEGIIEDGAHITGPCTVGKGTRVRSGAYITGPVAIGNDCEIGPNCYIRPATAIGDGCHIGAGVEIKNSIIMRGTKIPHLSYVGDSIIGENCNLGAGTKIANLRFDHGNIRVGGVDTGRRKFGAVLGDGVQSGINASINAGSMLGDEVHIWPGVTASGVIESRTRVCR